MPVARTPGNAGLHVEHDLIVVQRLHVAEALRHVGVRNIDVAFHAVEQRGCNGEESRCGVLISYGANVAGHAKNFLDDDDAAARCGLRFREIGRQAMAVGCGEFNLDSHGCELLKRWAQRIARSFAGATRVNVREWR